MLHPEDQFTHLGTVGKECIGSKPVKIMNDKHKEVKDGIFGLLSLGDSVWKEIELNPENEEKWLEVSVLADMAANYSTIYNVWCKDMINHRMKMRMMSEKKKGKKEKEDN